MSVKSSSQKLKTESRARKLVSCRPVAGGGGKGSRVEDSKDSASLQLAVRRTAGTLNSLPFLLLFFAIRMSALFSSARKNMTDKKKA